MGKHIDSFVLKRIGAFVIDVGLILIFGGIILLVNLIVYGFDLNQIPIYNELTNNLLSLIIVVPAMIYSIVMEYSNKHATIGKIIMNIKVVSDSNAKLKLMQIVIRNIVKYLPWQLAHMLILHAFSTQWELTPVWLIGLLLVNLLPIMYMLIIIFNKQHRGLQDIIAKTVVVKTK